MEAYKHLKKLETKGLSDEPEINQTILDLINAAYADMDDDFNTPRALSQLFAIVPMINSFVDGKIEINTVSKTTLLALKEAFDDFLNNILALKNDLETGSGATMVDGLMDLIIDIRQSARENKDWTTSDAIRDKMNELNIVLKDGAEGTGWTLK